MRLATHEQQSAWLYDKLSITGMWYATFTTGDTAKENIMKSKVFIGVNPCHPMKL